MPGRARGLSGIMLYSAQRPSLRRGLAAAAAWGGLVRGWLGAGFTKKALVSTVHARLNKSR